jgi:tRNA threonylcarbamoyladenosine biosynthesis protein TsaB
VILGIDSSDEFLSVGLSDGEKIIISHSSDPMAKNKNMLHSFIKRILDEAEINIDSFDGAALAIGPGSFTGLRVGLAVAKGICWSLNLTLAGVSSLMPIAVCANNSTGRILAIKDARRSEFYYAGYEKKGSELKQLIPDSVGPPDDLLDILGQGFSPVGPGVHELSKYAPGTIFSETEYDRELLGGAIAVLGYRLIKEGKILNLSSAAPNYIRTPKPKEWKP